MSEELAHCITPNLEGQVIFSQGFLPLAFDELTPNYKAAVSVTLEQLYQRKPPGKRKRGRPNKSWREKMMTAMQSRGLNIEDAQDRRLWRIGTGRRH
jgi:hypothetical protein